MNKREAILPLTEPDQISRVGGLSGGRGGTVQSVERAFNLLERLADAGGELSAHDLARATGLPQPTVHRLLRTLIATGHVYRSDPRAYALGPALTRLGEIAQHSVGAAAHPYLVLLAQVTGETANLAMLDTDSIVYVAQALSTHSMRMFTNVGGRVPAHSTGVGKAILAQRPERAVRELLTRTGLPSRTQHTITSPDQLLAELRQTRARGYAVDHGEQELAVCCVAVPVPCEPVRYAISISGPDTRLSDEPVRRAVPRLQHAAAQLAIALCPTGRR